MRVWLDTEFNGFEGDLISIGLIAEDGQFLYAVRNAILGMVIDPWVKEHVIPFLYKAPHEDYVAVWEHDDGIRYRLENFLARYDNVEIIVDWPEDIHHLCKLMITGAGTMINTSNITFVLDRMLDGVSEVPHNAIFDAIGNMKDTLNNEYIQKKIDTMPYGKV